MSVSSQRQAELAMRWALSRDDGFIGVWAGIVSVTGDVSGGIMSCIILLSGLCQTVPATGGSGSGLPKAFWTLERLSVENDAVAPVACELAVVSANAVALPTGFTSATYRRVVTLATSGSSQILPTTALNTLEDPNVLYIPKSGIINASVQAIFGNVNGQTATLYAQGRLFDGRTWGQGKPAAAPA